MAVGILLLLIKENNWISEAYGEYQHRVIQYQLCSFDKSICKFLCDRSITGIYNIVVSVMESRIGSHYTEWVHRYSIIGVERVEINHVPEQVIPEHDEVVITKLKNVL